ncbi:MAG: hypothetical protein AAFW46_02050 [Pseudomonadota bacterium]
MTDGRKLSGVVTRAGGGYLAIRTADGVKLTPLEAVRAVTVFGRDGEVVSGALENWRDGAFEIVTASGPLTVEDRDAAEIENDIDVDPRMNSPLMDREVDELRIFAQAPEAPAIGGAAERAAALDSGPVADETDAAPSLPTAPFAATPAPLAPADGIARARKAQPKEDVQTAASRAAAPRNTPAETATERSRANLDPAQSEQNTPPERTASEAPPPAEDPLTEAPLTAARGGSAGSAAQTTVADAADVAIEAGAGGVPPALVSDAALEPDSPPDLSALPGRGRAAEIASTAETSAARQGARQEAGDEALQGAQQAPGQSASQATRDGLPPSGPAGAPPSARGAGSEQRGDRFPTGDGPQISTAPPLPRGAFAQLGPSNSGELRSVLKGIIHGGDKPESSTATSPSVATTASDAAAPIAAEPERAARAGAEPASSAAPPERTASIGSLSASAPAAPAGALSVDPDARALAESVGEAAGIDACWSLAAQDRPFASTAPERLDPSALLISADEQIPLAVLERLFASDLAQAGAEPSIATLDDEAIEIAQVVGPLGPRLSRPSSYRLRRIARSDDALADAVNAKADLALTLERVEDLGRRRAGPSQAAPLGLLPISARTAESGPVSSLSRGELKGLLSGAISDWSMLDPARRGPPKLYLPPVGSTAMDALLDYVGVRRANPAAPVYAARPEDRLRAALDAGDGVAFVVGAGGDRGRAVAIDGAADISPEALRRGAYPLTIALIATPAASPPAHPLARPVTERLARADGARALLEPASVAAFAACADTADCAPEFAGVAAPSGNAPRAHPPLSVAIEALAEGGTNEVLARIAAPIGDEAGLKDALAGFMARRAARPDWIPRALTLRMSRSKSAAIRVEAAALALRCAGAPVSAAILDPNAELPTDAIEIWAR